MFENPYKSRVFTIFTVASFLSKRAKENLHPKRDAGFLSFGAADLALNRQRRRRGGLYNDFTKYIAPRPQV